MRVLIGLHVAVGILHHQEFQLLQRLADARRVRHGGHGIGGDEPQTFDLPGLDRGQNIGHEKAALLREKLGIDTPKLGNFFAMRFILQRAITRQPGTRRPLARAHCIRLTSDRKRGAAGFADVASNEIEVVDRHHAVRAVGALIDAHGPEGHGRAGLGIQARHMADGVFVDAADA